MGRLIVIQFITLDGVVEDPDGNDRSPFGGWAMRFGPQRLAGDKFRLGPILAHGTLLFGRNTWDHFADLWPRRSDPFSQGMNAATKVVVTHREIDEERWSNSRAIDQPLTAWVRDHLPTTDIVVIGSGSVVAVLASADLIDEHARGRERERQHQPEGLQLEPEDVDLGKHRSLGYAPGYR